MLPTPVSAAAAAATTITPAVASAVQVGTMLQALLSDHLPHLTHLSLGTVQAGVPGRPVHYSLSAPLRMPALASLACNLGFSLDVESDIDDESTQQIQDSQQQPPAAAAAAAAAAAGNSSGSRETGVPAARRHKPLPDLLAALTQLILVDPACVPDVIERATASKAACSQLQHLELPQLHFDDADDGLDYNAFDDQQQQARPDPAVATLQRLGQLSSLRQLATVVRGQWQLNALVAAVGSQLHGLTVTCQLDTTVYWPIDFDYDYATGRGEQVRGRRESRRETCLGSSQPAIPRRHESSLLSPLPCDQASTTSPAAS